MIANNRTLPFALLVGLAIHATGCFQEEEPKEVVIPPITAPAEPPEAQRFLILGAESTYIHSIPRAYRQADYQAIFRIGLHHHKWDVPNFIRLDKQRTGNPIYTFHTEPVVLWDFGMTKNAGKKVEPAEPRRNMRGSLHRGYPPTEENRIMRGVVARVDHVVVNRRFDDAPPKGNLSRAKQKAFVFGDKNELWSADLMHGPRDNGRIFQIQFLHGIYRPDSQEKTIRGAYMEFGQRLGSHTSLQRDPKFDAKLYLVEPVATAPQDSRVASAEFAPELAKPPKEKPQPPQSSFNIFRKDPKPKKGPTGPRNESYPKPSGPLLVHGTVAKTVWQFDRQLP